MTDKSVENFITRRQSDWKRLDQLLDRSGAGMLSHLTGAEIEELGRLYRSVTSDLALAQRDYADHRVTVYLNQLVGRGHTVVYRPAPSTPERIRAFFTASLPRLYREALPFVLVAGLLLLLPGLIAGLAAATHPDAATWLGLQRQANIMQDGQLWTSIPIAQRPGASSFIMQNNIQVSFLAFAGGVPFGVLAVYVLVRNGLHLGGVLGLAARYGLAGELLTFIVGHGVIELSVVCIAGGSGLMIGWSLLNPGLLHRRDALVVAARKAAQLLACCVPVLIVAGVIEAFISPSTLPPIIKAAVGLTTGAVMHTYLLLSGRKNTDRTTSQEPDLPGL